jgi:8-oxo-dGTP diphosphatase
VGREKTTGNSKVVCAAGGLLWFDTPEGRKLTIILRTKDQDYALPKGKLDEDEEWLDAALREVGEETGIAAQVESFAGSVSYILPKGSPKVVLYWNMTPVGTYTSGGKRVKTYPDPREIQEVCHVSIAQALALLSHDSEKQILYVNLDSHYRLR